MKICKIAGIVLLVSGAILAPVCATAAEVELAFLNATYSDLDSGLEPIEEGPLTITLSSPEHRLTVFSNRLTFTVNRLGRFDVAFEAELDGEGRLVADVAGGGVERRFTDDVAAPRQTVRASGEVYLEKVDTGYQFTVARRGPGAAIEIQSGLAGQIVGICRAVALLPLFDLGCDRLERALSIVRIPMPELGTRFVLPADNLSKSERRFFDQLLKERQKKIGDRDE